MIISGDKPHILVRTILVLASSGLQEGRLELNVIFVFHIMSMYF